MAGNECRRIFVGNLPPETTIQDVEHIFYDFGKITDVELKHRPRTFAFVEFKYSEDAKDAVIARSKGYKYHGYRLRVEHQNPRGMSSSGSSRSSGASTLPRHTLTPIKRTPYRVIVSGLPPRTSWQDLKYHMQEAGYVCYANTFDDGTGVVDFLFYEEMKYAVKLLDDSRFKSRHGEKSYITLKEDYRYKYGNASNEVSRDRSRTNRSRSRSTPSITSRSPTPPRRRHTRSPSSYYHHSR